MQRRLTTRSNQIWTIPAWALTLGGFVLLLFVILCYILFWPRHPEASRGGPARRPQQTAQLAPPSKLSPTAPTPRPPEAPANAAANPVLPPAPTQTTVPANTQISIQTTALIDSNADPVGSRFPGTITSPLVVNGTPVVPQGSAVVLHLADKKKTGFFHRFLQIKVALAGISVNGRIYPVQAGILSIKAGQNDGITVGEGGDTPASKGKSALVILPNTTLTFTLATPLTVVSPAEPGSASVNSGK